MLILFFSLCLGINSFNYVKIKGLEDVKIKQQLIENNDKVNFLIMKIGSDSNK
jgi:hypothetical protein